VIHEEEEDTGRPVSSSHQLLFCFFISLSALQTAYQIYHWLTRWILCSIATIVMPLDNTGQKNVRSRVR
jgi:hypothetical protein